MINDEPNKWSNNFQISVSIYNIFCADLIRKFVHKNCWNI